jgi:hypothetical protein
MLCEWFIIIWSNVVCVKLISNCCTIRYLFQFILPPYLVSYGTETVLLHLFDIIAEVDKVKTSLRESSESERMKKSGCFVQR